MTKYLRVHKDGADVTGGKRYEIVEENAELFTVIDDAGDEHTWSKVDAGKTFTLEDSAPITVLPDESLGGTLREYREVKRTANDGDRVIYKDSGRIATCYTRTVKMPHETWTSTANSASDMRVLEPTDILRIDDARFRMVERKAAVGERMIVTKVRAGYGIFSAGNVGIAQDEPGLFDFNGQGNVNYNADDGVWYVGPYNGNSEYRVLESLPSAEPTTPLSALPLVDQYAENITVLTRKIAELEERSNTLEERILALETDSAPAIVKVAEGPVDTTLPSFAKTPQMIRDEIVERAKADVSDLRKFSGTDLRGTPFHFWPQTDLPTQYYPLHDVEYVINREKRTVAALIRSKSHGVLARGIAKCAPGETFNSHIGRAIALYRALGLEVPAEYLTCPQPSEVRVGDLITFEGVKQYGNVYAVSSLNTRGSNLRIVASSMDDLIGETAYGGDLNDGNAILLDDSREDGGTSASPSALKGAA